MSTEKSFLAADNLDTPPPYTAKELLAPPYSTNTPTTTTSMNILGQPSPTLNLELSAGSNLIENLHPVDATSAEPLYTIHYRQPKYKVTHFNDPDVQIFRQKALISTITIHRHTSTTLDIRFPTTSKQIKSFDPEKSQSWPVGAASQSNIQWKWRGETELTAEWSYMRGLLTNTSSSPDARTNWTAILVMRTKEDGFLRIPTSPASGQGKQSWDEQMDFLDQIVAIMVGVMHQRRGNEKKLMAEKRKSAVARSGGQGVSSYTDSSGATSVVASVSSVVASTL